MRAGKVFTIVSAAALSACAQRAQSPALPPSPSVITEEPVTLTTPTGDLFGTVELPAARFPVPAVLIIAGSGPTDRDGNSPILPGKNNSLKMLADGLASRGIASLRYDKRGIAASAKAASKEEDLRFENSIADAAGWLAKLREDRRFSSVTVAGHSEGSLVGMVAAREANANAYVSLAGVGRKADEVLIDQLSAQLPPPVLEQVRQILAKLSAGQTPDSVPPYLNALFRPSVQPYMRSWLAYDPQVEIAKLKIPVMIIQGTTDLQVKVDDANRLAAASPRAKLVIVDGMNHVLKQASGPIGEQLKSYSDSTILVVPRVIDEIAAFAREARAPRVADTAFGNDKLRHFLMAGYTESIGFAGLQAAGVDRDAALVGGVLAAATASVAKEFADRRAYGLFSVGDLVWDALGASAAMLILRKTTR